MANSSRVAFNSLFDFLNRHRANNSNEITHCSSVSPKGSFFIPENELNEFYGLYHTCITHPDIELTIVERCPMGHSPIKIDIDLKIPLKNNGNESGSEVSSPEDSDNETNAPQIRKHFYTADTIQQLIYRYFVELDKYIDREELGDIKVFLLEKPYPNIKQADGIIKDGFHIVIPDLVVPNSVQFFIREQLIQPDIFKTIFRDIPYQGTAGDVFDKAVIENNWTLYGSKGKRGGSIYKTTRMFKVGKSREIITCFIDNPLEIPLPTLYKTPAQYLSVRNKPLRIAYTSEEAQKTIEEYYHSKVEKRRRVGPKKARIYDPSISLELVRKLIRILSPDRATNYDDWIRLCWCLSNIDPENLLEDFLEFSKLDLKKYDEDYCLESWQRSLDRETQNTLGLGTLHYWAKQDNPEEYQKIISEDVFLIIQQELPETSVSIARIMKKLYGSEFISAFEVGCRSKKKWYQFCNHRWVPDADARLRRKIHEDLPNYYKQIEKSYYRMASMATKKDEIKSLNDKASKVNKIIARLEDTSFIDKIINEASFFFLDENFNEKADENDYLIGFENGVYDLENFQFREGLPDDYITLSTKINYIPYKEHGVRFKEVMKFMNEILPNKAVRDYTLYVLATGLSGENSQQKFYLFTGEGGNGKSVLVKIIENALGEYRIAMNVGYITQKRGEANKASPEAMDLYKKRLGIFSEPDKGDYLNMGIVKLLTGDDRIKARGLYKGNIEFTNKATLILLCNDVPTPSSHGQAEIRRFRVVKFPVSFVETPTEEYERKADPDIGRKVKHWNEALVSILIEYFRRMKQKHDGLIPEPPEVSEFTREFQEKTNIFLQFQHECLEQRKAEEAEKILSIMDIYQAFKTWHLSSYPNTKCSPKADLCDFLTKKFKKAHIKSRGLKGYKLKELEIEENNENDM